MIFTTRFGIRLFWPTHHGSGPSGGVHTDDRTLKPHLIITNPGGTPVLHRFHRVTMPRRGCDLRS
eukprot:1602998-Amphidinium_carterae.1